MLWGLRMRLLQWTLAVYLMCLAACTHDVSFWCVDPGYSSCPLNEVCPELALGSGGCEELPGLFGHAPIPVTVGRPVGCMVRLPYDNPYFGDQQACRCEANFPVPGTDSTVTQARWICPL